MAVTSVGGPPPQGSVPVSMSWAFSPHPPSMTQECAAEAAAAAHTEAAQGVCRGTGKPVDVLASAVLASMPALLRCSRWASHIRQSPAHFISLRRLTRLRWPFQG